MDFLISFYHFISHGNSDLCLPYHLGFSFIGLCRCMTTRRDDPDGTLWRLAVDGFHRILIDDVRKLNPSLGTDLTITRSSRTHVWKEVADVYELFLVGHCGRALPSNTLSAAACQADESLEMNILDILGDKILRSETDLPLDVISTYLRVTKYFPLDVLYTVYLKLLYMKIIIQS